MSVAIEIDSIYPPPSDEEAAAISAALELLAAQASPPQPATSPAGWRDSAKLAVQGLAPAKLASPLRWQRVEQLRRSAGSFYGVVGL